MNNPDLPADDEHTNALVSVPPPGSQWLVTTDHRTVIGGYCGGRSNPYHTRQGRNKGGATWVFNAGSNVNLGGHQKNGNIIVGNSCIGASLPRNFPQHGRFIINIGGNVNRGDFQERGDIVFGNTCL